MKKTKGKTSTQMFPIRKRGKTMKKASYSDNVSKLATVEQAKERYKLSRNLLIKIAEDNKAIRRFGRAVRIDVSVMDKAVDLY
ncbi:hypothetical protein D3Z45_03270 [Lachnospiraceae bacterium]|nr:hypothetical protein [Lachnospiraceae bacterium]